MDIFRIEDPGLRPLPVVVMIHGGGLVVGTRKLYRRQYGRGILWGKKQVRFSYGGYGTDLKIHPGKRSNGEISRQTINPYQMVACDGRYYLICNNDRYDNIAHYRIDRITDIELLETPAKPMKLVQGLENGLRLREYVYRSPNMFTGKPEEVTFVIPVSRDIIV